MRTCGDFYAGAYSHMERFGGSVVVPYCYASESTGTAIYKSTWNESIICGILEVEMEGYSE